MYIKQAELFWGVGTDFLKAVMDITAKEPFEPGTVIFRAGDPARYFYILIQGSVKVSIGDADQMVYAGCQAGETFGWSSLIGRDVYTATAVCTEQTTLLKIDRNDFQKLIDSDSRNGLVFLKHLAACLGNRLLQSYRIISDHKAADGAASSS